MLQNAHFLAKIGADTAENEQHLAEICQISAIWQAGFVDCCPPAGRRSRWGTGGAGDDAAADAELLFIAGAIKEGD